MIKRILLYGMWLLSTFGAFMFAHRPVKMSMFDGDFQDNITRKTPGIICFSNKKLEVILDIHGNIKAIESRRYKQQIIDLNQDKSILSVTYDDLKWGLYKDNRANLSDPHVIFSSYRQNAAKQPNKIFRTVRLVENKIIFQDQFEEVREGVSYVTEFKLKPNSSNYLLINNKLIRNDYKTSWFTGSKTISDGHLIKKDSTFTGIVSRDLLYISNMANSGQLVHTNTDGNCTIVTTVSHPKIKDNKIVHEFEVDSIDSKGMQNIKYNDTWFSFIPKVLDLVLIQCQRVLSNPIVSFLAFIFILLGLSLPLFYVEYKKRKFAAEVGMRDLPQESSLPDFMLNILFGLIMYYVNVWVIPMNVVLNNIPFLWYDSVNTIEKTNILNLFGYLNIDLPKTLQFGPISLIYAYFLMTNMLNVKIKGQWKLVIFYILLMISSHLIPLSVMLVVFFLVILKNIVINALVNRGQSNDDNVIRIS